MKHLHGSKLLSFLLKSWIYVNRILNDTFLLLYIFSRCLKYQYCYWIRKKNPFLSSKCFMGTSTKVQRLSEYSLSVLYPLKIHVIKKKSSFHHIVLLHFLILVVVRAIEMMVTQLLTGKNGNSSEAVPKFKVEFRLDKLVRWLSVYLVSAIAIFLTSVQEFFKGKYGFLFPHEWR